MVRMRCLLSIVIVLIGLVAGSGLAASIQSSFPAQAGLSASAGIPAAETPLDEAGEAYEVNPDPQGLLWISDYGAGEIRRLDPETGSYSVYPVGGRPSDARSDGAGSLWWVDFASKQVGRLSLADDSTSIWEVSGSSNLLGTGLGTNGDIWVSDADLPYLYHLSPASSEVCTYTLPLDGASDYLLVDGGHIWLGDSHSKQIDRLDVAGGTFTSWGLPAGSHPTGMAMDGSGGLWWADPILGYLAHLTPGSNQVITYTQTVAQKPQMLALDEGKVWYSDPTNVGALDPAHAAGNASTLTPQSAAATITCSTLAAPTTKQIVPSPGQVSWTDVNYPTVSSPAGWQVFQLPQGSSTWGIAAQGEHIWLVDQGRQVLAKIPKKIETQVFLPFVKR